MTQYDDDADLLGEACEQCGTPNIACRCGDPCPACDVPMHAGYCPRCGFDPVEAYEERRRRRLAERNEY